MFDKSTFISTKIPNEFISYKHCNFPFLYFPKAVSISSARAVTLMLVTLFLQRFKTSSCRSRGKKSYINAVEV